MLPFSSPLCQSSRNEVGGGALFINENSAYSAWAAPSNNAEDHSSKTYSWHGFSSTSCLDKVIKAASPANTAKQHLAGGRDLL